MGEDARGRVVWVRQLARSPSVGYAVRIRWARLVVHSAFRTFSLMHRFDTKSFGLIERRAAALRRIKQQFIINKAKRRQSSLMRVQ